MHAFHGLLPCIYFGLLSVLGLHSGGLEPRLLDNGRLGGRPLMELFELFIQAQLLFGKKRSRAIIFFVSLALVSEAHWRVLVFLWLSKA